jgi:hypothetical protein
MIVIVNNKTVAIATYNRDDVFLGVDMIRSFKQCKDKPLQNNSLECHEILGGV